MNDRRMQAIRIAESAKRLEKFSELGAPEFLIEKERQMLMRKLIVFPVNQEALENVVTFDNDYDRDQQKFLADHGFFDDVGDIDG